MAFLTSRSSSIFLPKIGETPLHLAASCEHLKCMQMLADFGADIEAKSTRVRSSTHNSLKEAAAAAAEAAAAYGPKRRQNHHPTRFDCGSAPLCPSFPFSVRMDSAFPGCHLQPSEGRSTPHRPWG